MGLFFFVLLVFPKVFRKQKKPSRKPKIPKKTKENQKKHRETKKTMFLKVSDPPLGYGFVFFVLLVFPKVLLVFFCMFGFLKSCLGFVKTFGKTKKTTKRKNISKGESETFKNFVFVGFPDGVFGFVWFSFVCLVFSKMCFVF